MQGLHHCENAMSSKSSPTPLGQAVPCQPLFIGVPEVARRFSLGQTSTWALIRDGKLPVVRIGRRTLVSVKALEEFAANLTSAKG
jgi:excisionase family DNA binding protein